MSQTVWNWVFTGLLVAQSLEIIHLLKEQTLMKIVISGLLCAMDEVKVKKTENGIALVRGDTDNEDSEDDDQ